MYSSRGAPDFRSCAPQVPARRDAPSRLVPVTLTGPPGSPVAHDEARRVQPVVTTRGSSPDLLPTFSSQARRGLRQIRHQLRFPYRFRDLTEDRCNARPAGLSPTESVPKKEHRRIAARAGAGNTAQDVVAPANASPKYRVAEAASQGYCGISRWGQILTRSDFDHQRHHPTPLARFNV